MKLVIISIGATTNGYAKLLKSVMDLVGDIVVNYTIKLVVCSFGATLMVAPYY